MIDSNNQLKTLSKSLLNAVRGVMEATKDPTHPKTDKHKNLAAKAPPYDKITHADVLVGRGVLKKHPTTGKLVTKEKADQIDELSTDTMNNYARERSRTAFSGGRKPGQSVDDGIKMKSKQINSMALSKTKINRVRDTGSTILNKEEVEVIDEALDAAARYGQHHVAIKELMKSISQHVESHKGDALKHRDYRGKKGVNWGHVGDVAQIHSQLADIHDRLAQQGEYKKSMAESVEDLDIEQIDELSTKTLKSYRTAARNDAYDAADVDDEPRFRKRAAGSNTAGKKLVKRGESLKTEDLELDEARGRPRKNPLPIADVEPEPRQHIIQQLQRAKLSMRGGEDVTFKNGKKGHVSGPHAAKILSRYAGMRPAEKEDFQKKIGASHEAFKQHL